MYLIPVTHLSLLHHDQLGQSLAWSLTVLCPAQLDLDSGACYQIKNDVAVACARTEVYLCACRCIHEHVHSSGCAGGYPGGDSEATTCPWFPSSMVAQCVHPKVTCQARIRILR
jgi:hypothetical protein